MRVAVDGGERVVGVRYREVLIPEVEVVLKEQKLNDRLARVQAVSDLPFLIGYRECVTRHFQELNKATNGL